MSGAFKQQAKEALQCLIAEARVDSTWLEPFTEGLCEDFQLPPGAPLEALLEKMETAEVVELFGPFVSTQDWHLRITYISNPSI